MAREPSSSSSDLKVVLISNESPESDTDIGRTSPANYMSFRCDGDESQLIITIQKHNHNKYKSILKLQAIVFIL